ncbi:porin [Cupriavidus basilensis]
MATSPLAARDALYLPATGGAKRSTARCWPGAAAFANQRSNLWWAGARWQATSNVTLAGAAYYQDFAGTNADPWMFVASGVYAFSKRTSAYLAVGYSEEPKRVEPWPRHWWLRFRHRLSRRQPVRRVSRVASYLLRHSADGSRYPEPFALDLHGVPHRGASAASK